MHDKNGVPIHPKDHVIDHATGKSFHVHGYAVVDHTGAKHVAFSQNLEVLTTHSSNVGVEELPGECIVWGNGPPPV